MTYILCAACFAAGVNFGFLISGLMQAGKEADTFAGGNRKPNIQPHGQHD